MSGPREGSNFLHAVEDLVTVFVHPTGLGEVETRVLGPRLRRRRVSMAGVAVWRPGSKKRIAERWATWDPAVDPL